MSNNGFNGVILHVNLTFGRVSTEELPSRNVEMFLGRCGRFLGLFMQCLSSACIQLGSFRPAIS